MHSTSAVGYARGCNLLNCVDCVEACYAEWNPPPLPPYRKPEVLSFAALPLNSLTRLLDLDVASCAVIELNEDDRTVGIAAAGLREAEVISVAIADAGVLTGRERLLSIR